MTAAVALLRGINVGGAHKLPMASLRTICEGLGLADVRTLIASGNVVFRAKSLAKLGAGIEAAIEAAHGFRPPVILRTAAELETAMAANPFSAEMDPAKVLVMFLAEAPSAAQRASALALAEGHIERLHAVGRELFIYFPDGQGRSKLPMAKIEKALGTHGTGRNWSTVLKLREMVRA